MSAVVSVRPIVKPRYTTLANDTFQRWYVRNEPALTQYWDELEQADLEAQCGTGCDFLEFAFVQYDVECELRAAGHDEGGRDAREFFESEQCPSDPSFR